MRLNAFSKQRFQNKYLPIVCFTDVYKYYTCRILKMFFYLTFVCMTYIVTYTIRTFNFLPTQTSHKIIALEVKANRDFVKFKYCKKSLSKSCKVDKLSKYNDFLCSIPRGKENIQVQENLGSIKKSLKTNIIQNLVILTINIKQLQINV